MSRRKPVRTETAWVEHEADTTPATQLTPPGRHPMVEYLADAKERNKERRARTLRNLGGRERDRRRIPPAQYQESGRTWKSSSKVRFPSQAFRRNFDLIRWDQ